MERWRLAWREGFAPVLPTAGLAALRDALRDDDPRLRQGCTTYPLHTLGNSSGSLPVEGACALGFCGWQGEGLGTVAEVRGYFNRVCDAAYEKADGRHFLRWFDEIPRDEMRRELLAEVERVLAGRAESPAPAGE